MDIQNIKSEDLHVGDSVYVDIQDQEGTVISVNGQEASINFPGNSGWPIKVNSDGFWGSEGNRGLLKWGRYPSVNIPDLPYGGGWDYFEESEDKTELMFTRYQELDGSDGIGIKISIEEKENFIYAEPGQQLKLYSFDGTVEGNLMIKGEKSYCIALSEMRVFKTKVDAELYLESIKDIEKLREEENKRKLEVAGITNGDYVGIKVKEFLSISSSPNSHLTDLLNSDSSYVDCFIVDQLGMIVDDYVKVKLKDIEGFVPSNFMEKITKAQYEERKKNTVYRRIARSMIQKMAASHKESQLTTAQLYSTFLQRLREDSELGRKLNEADADPTEIIKTVIGQLQSNLDTLKKDKRIKSVKFDEVEFNLEIITEDMFIHKVSRAGSGKETDITKEYFDKPLKIGKFRINIDLIKMTFKAKRTSKIKNIHGDHPHMGSYLCWGNMQSASADAMKRMDIHAVTLIFLEIVENVRQGDHLISMERFYTPNE